MFFLILLAKPVFAGFGGLKHVVDGDSLRVDNITVQIHGIDAPEIEQTCYDVQGRI